MRVVVGHHVADDTRALHERAVGAQVRVVHRPEDAALHRLQPVADVGQRAATRSRSSSTRGTRPRPLRRACGSGCRPPAARRASTGSIRGPGLLTRAMPTLPVHVVPTRRGSGRLWRCAGSSCGGLRRRRPSAPTEHRRRRSVPSSTSSCTRWRRRGIHARLAQLVRVHLAETLEPRELQLAIRVLLDRRAAAPRRRRRRSSRRRSRPSRAAAARRRAGPASTSGIICR